MGLAAVAALLLGAARATGSTALTYDVALRAVQYTPARSPIRLDATATVQASYFLPPEMRQSWTSRGWPDEAIDNHRKAVAAVLANDVSASGLFARIIPLGGLKPDFAVTVQAEAQRPLLRVTIRATDPATGQELSARTREASLDNGRGGARDLKTLLPDLMAALKADLASDLQLRMRRRAALAAAAAFPTASLADLLSGRDELTVGARERNRALIAAKTRQLPAILRDGKSDELVALVVRIEQAILDLDHDGELARDRAQQLAATNGDPAQVEEIRGLGISFRERIELLKPILAALKEELANRNR